VGVRREEEEEEKEEEKGGRGAFKLSNCWAQCNNKVGDSFFWCSTHDAYVNHVLNGITLQEGVWGGGEGNDEQRENYNLKF
jgi:hypothetical protein